MSLPAHNRLSLYNLALGKLSVEGELDTETDPAKPAATAPVTAPAAAAPAAAPAPARVAAPVDVNHERGRGFRGVPNAGAPRRAITRDGLTNLMRRDFDAYKTLMKAQPHLEVFHLGGSDSPEG